MLVPILVGAGAVVAGVLGDAATRPDQFRVQRSARIDAPPDKNMDKMVGKDFEKGLEKLGRTVA